MSMHNLFRLFIQKMNAVTLHTVSLESCKRKLKLSVHEKKIFHIRLFLIQALDKSTRTIGRG